MNLKRIGLWSLALTTCALASWSCKETAKPAETTAIAEVINEKYPHPLNPLDTNEIKLVKEILLTEAKIDTTYRFYLINLNEPPKSEMLAYQSGQPFRREAFASVYDRSTNKTYEAIIDLKKRSVLSFVHIPGVTPGSFDRDSVAHELLSADASWLAGLEKRGIHPDSVRAYSAFAGDMGIAPPDHREIIVMPSYRNKKYEHLAIDGLAAYVDLTDMKVLKVVDDGAKGFYKPEDIDYFIADSGRALAKPTKPLKIVQPEGTSFKVEGFQVTNDNWSFRIGLHNREGLVIYDVKYNDRGKMRPVMYRASMAEMYVPYGSTDLGHASWNYFDGGAYRMGQAWPKECNGLKNGADVPENSIFLPGYFHNEKGLAKQIDSVIAVFEEYPGPITRHGTFSKDARNLAVKYFTQIGNYDYAFKWVFKEDGQIDLRAELTGIVGIKGVNRVTDKPGSEDDSYNGFYYGTLVAPHVEAVNHQHFFSFRLDMDVDGPENFVEEMNTVAVPAGPKNPYGNAFVMQMSLIQNEDEAKRNLNPGSNRQWMVANANGTNSLGQQKSYMLSGGTNQSPFALTTSGARTQADFLESQVWVTQYKEKESFPAGEYPNTRGIRDGLPTWSNGESLVKQDVVVWYNLGITHIVRPEEWPLMNVHTLGFSLMPNGFFDRNYGFANKHSPEKPELIVSESPQLPDVTVCVPLPKESKVSRGKGM